jgi:transcription elongation factor Elf1
MRKTEPESSGTYRCPVCGHGDSVEVSEQSIGRRIDCSYCGAALEISHRAPGSDRLTVRLIDASLTG